MFEELLARLARGLNRAGIPYMIIGGQAVLLYGEPRLTADIDVTIGLDLSGLGRLLKMSEDAGLAPLPEKIDEFVKQTMVLPVRDPKTSVRVDFVLSFTPYEAEAIRRARQVRIQNTDVAFAAPEDVIIHKIFSGRPRDIEDIDGILLKQRKLDRAYIEKWLAEFDRTFPGKGFLASFRAISERPQF